MNAVSTEDAPERPAVKSRVVFGEPDRSPRSGSTRVREAFAAESRDCNRDRLKLFRHLSSGDHDLLQEAELHDQIDNRILLPPHLLRSVFRCLAPRVKT